MNSITFEELKNLKQWVCFKLIPTPKDGDPDHKDKPPMNPFSGRGAQSNNPNTWGTYEQAKEGQKRWGFDGVGFVLTNGFAGIDLDYVIDKNGSVESLESWVNELVTQFNSYTEISPSGKGLHILVKTNDGVSYPGHKDKKSHPGSVLEMYNTGRYFTVTENTLGPIKPIEDRTETFKRVYEKHFGEIQKNVPGASTVEKIPFKNGPGTDKTDAEILEMMFSSENGAKLKALWEGDTSLHAGDHSAADAALVSHLVYWSNGDIERVDNLFRQSALYRDKWDQKHRSDGATYGDMTIESCMKDFKPYTGTTTAQEAFNNSNDNLSAESQKIVPGASTAEKNTSERFNALDSEFFTAAFRNLMGNEERLIKFEQEKGISSLTVCLFGLGYFEQWTKPGENEPRGEQLIIPLNMDSYIAKDLNSGQAEMIPNSNAIFNENAISSYKTVFVTYDVMDAISLTEVGAAAVALNQPLNYYKLIDAIKATEEKPALVLCIKGDTANSIKSHLSALNVRYIQRDLEGKEESIQAALKNDREGLKNRVIEAKIEAEKSEIDLFLDRIKSEAYKPYKTGVSFLDKILSGGFTQQTVTIILAQPGAGKTTLCQQIARSLAINKKEVVFYNLEMSKEQMIARDISARLFSKYELQYTPLDILRGYSWDVAKAQTIERELKSYESYVMPYLHYVEIKDGKQLDVDGFQEALTQLGESAKAAGKEAPAVILDYLHLLGDNKKNSTEADKIRRAMLVIKDYARNYNTFVIAVSATNRDAYKQEFIGLGSARDSSNIEYGADVELSISFERLTEKNGDKEVQIGINRLMSMNPRKLIIEAVKNRFGTMGQRVKANLYPAQSYFCANTINAQEAFEVENNIEVVKPEESGQSNFSNTNEDDLKKFAK